MKTKEQILEKYLRYWDKTTIEKKQALLAMEEYANEVVKNLNLHIDSNNEVDLDNLAVEIPATKSTKYKMIPTKEVAVCDACNNSIYVDEFSRQVRISNKCYKCGK